MSSQAQPMLKCRVLLIGAGVVPLAFPFATIDEVWAAFEEAGILEGVAEDGTRQKIYSAGVGMLGEREPAIAPARPAILMPGRH